MIDDISIPYFVLTLFALAYYYISNNKRLFISNNYLLGIVVSIILLISVGKLLVAFFSGYFFEFLAESKRNYGQWYYVKITLLTFASVLPLFNYRKKYRNNFNFQSLILGIFMGLVILSFIKGIDTQVDAGWHTNVSNRSLLSKTSIILALGLSFNLAIVKLEFLPEFKSNGVS